MKAIDILKKIQEHFRAAGHLTSMTLDPGLRVRPQRWPAGCYIYISGRRAAKDGIKRTIEMAEHLLKKEVTGNPFPPRPVARR